MWDLYLWNHPMYYRDFFFLDTCVESQSPRQEITSFSVGSAKSQSTSLTQGLPVAYLNPN